MKVCVNGAWCARLPLLGSLLLLAACADGQAPRANCFDGTANGVTISTMGPAITAGGEPCAFIPLPGAE